MNVRIFIYNVVGAKANFNELKDKIGGIFVLIASNYALQQLKNNKLAFDAIHPISRDFHQLDYNEIWKIISSYVDQYDSESICLLSNEDSTQLSCAKLRKEFGIKGANIKQVLPFVDKVVSKQSLAELVTLPKFIHVAKASYLKDQKQYIEEVISELSFPMLAKPIDLVSSIGVFKIIDRQELEQKLELIVNSSYEYEIDEFINGDLYHCDIIVSNGRIIFQEVCRYMYPLAEFARGKPMGSIPLPLNSQIRFKIIEVTKLIINKLVDFSSALHFEFFVTVNEEIIFLEAAARTPGALLTNIYEIMYDINIEELHYLVQLMDIAPPLLMSKTFASWVSYPSIKGKFKEFKLLPNNLTSQTIILRQDIVQGEMLKPATSLLDSIYSVVAYDECYSNLQDTFSYLKNFNPVTMKL